MIVTVRKYQDNDLKNVLSSWENASKLAHPILTDLFLAKEREKIPQLYLPVAETWVAELNVVVIGFISLLGNEVGAIFVQPEFHKTGTGRALMDKAVNLRGDLDVEVFEANTIGRRFYSDYGFESVAKKVHEETGNVLVRMKYTVNKSI